MAFVGPLCEVQSLRLNFNWIDVDISLNAPSQYEHMPESLTLYCDEDDCILLCANVGGSVNYLDGHVYNNN